MLYDSIVVGAGIEGSATAYYLAKKKRNTLLLEQFPLPHSRGNSHGQSRAIRYSYKDGIYSRMMEEAYTMWHQLEKETDSKLYIQTGMLTLQESDHGGSIDYRIQNDRDINQPITELSGDEINKRYPGVNYWPSYRGFIEHKAGVLLANKCLLAFQNQFVKFGGTLQDNEKVTNIIPGNIVTVETNNGRYRTKRVVLTVGPWASQVLRPLGLNPPLKTWCINVCYWKEKKPGTLTNFPIFAEVACNDRYLVPGQKLPNHMSVVYGLPILEYPGMMKLGYYTGNEPVLPDERDKITTVEQKDIQMLQKYVRDHFPCLEDEPAIVEHCMYTKTPDEHPILDKHPLHPNIVIGVGMSGHGFKLAPIFGKVLYELAMGQTPSYDLTMFSCRRFDEFDASDALFSKL